jgi:hypothetical protein
MESFRKEKIGLKHEASTQFSGYVPRRESYFNPLPHVLKSEGGKARVETLDNIRCHAYHIRVHDTLREFLFAKRAKSLAWLPNSGSGVVRGKSDSAPTLTSATWIASPRHRSNMQWITELSALFRNQHRFQILTPTSLRWEPVQHRPTTVGDGPLVKSTWPWPVETPFTQSAQTLGSVLKLRHSTVVIAEERRFGRLEM